MNTEDRKQARKAYKESESLGGLFRIVNTESGWESPLMATTDLQGRKNRLAFAKKTHTRFDETLREQWAAYAPEVFEFVEVERLSKKPEMTAAAFIEELNVLLAMYRQEDL